MKVTVLVRKKSRNVEAVKQAATIANRIQPEFEFDVEEVKWLPKGDSEVKPRQDKLSGRLRKITLADQSSP